MSTTRNRHLTSSELLRWADDRAGVMRLNTDRDVLPGGYMAALAPLLVAWPASHVSADGAEVVVRNVNYGGNPFERTTMLNSVRLSLEAVESAELILVPSNELGRRNPVHHVQIRYIFEEGSEPVLLNLADAQTGTDPRIPDLVLSWESWRPPEQRFNLKDGLAQGAYGLSLRAYAGAQRYLEDTIRGRQWYASPLQLPGGRRGLRDLLGISLALGDGVARDTLARLLKTGKEEWLAQAPGGADESTIERWRDLKARLPREVELEARLPKLAADDESYNSLLRSCATLSRYLILLAARRLVARGEGEGFDLDHLPAPTLGEPQPWMTEVASTDLLGVFMRAPAALRFVLSHPESVPGRLPSELDAAGLIRCKDGKRIETVYGRSATRPYGSDGIRRMA